MPKLAAAFLAALLSAACAAAGPTPATTPTPTPAASVPVGGFVDGQPLWKRTTGSGPCAPGATCTTELVVQLDGRFTYRDGAGPEKAGQVPAADLDKLKRVLAGGDFRKLDAPVNCGLADYSEAHAFNAQAAIHNLDYCQLHAPAAQVLADATEAVLKDVRGQ